MIEMLWFAVGFVATLVILTMTDVAIRYRNITK